MCACPFPRGSVLCMSNLTGAGPAMLIMKDCPTRTCIIIIDQLPTGPVPPCLLYLLMNSKACTCIAIGSSPIEIEAGCPLPAADHLWSFPLMHILCFTRTRPHNKSSLIIHEIFVMLWKYVILSCHAQLPMCMHPTFIVFVQEPCGKAI